MAPAERGIARETTGSGVDTLFVHSKDKFPQLKVGDKLPHVVGSHWNPKTQIPEPFAINSLSGIKVLSIVNMHRTDTCDLQTAWMDGFHRSHQPGVTAVSISKQNADDLGRVTQEQDLVHPLIHIDTATAEALGVGLSPDNAPNGGDDWNKMLLRMVAVVDGDNTIRHIEYVPEQMDEPNYRAVDKTVVRIVAGYVLGE